MNKITVHIRPYCFDGAYYASYYVPKKLMRAIASDRTHEASSKEKLHLMLIGIPIPCGMPVKISPTDETRKGYDIRVNPIEFRCDPSWWGRKQPVQHRGPRL